MHDRCQLVSYVVLLTVSFMPAAVRVRERDNNMARPEVSQLCEQLNMQCKSNYKPY